MEDLSNLRHRACKSLGHQSLVRCNVACWMPADVITLRLIKPLGLLRTERCLTCTSCEASPVWLTEGGMGSTECSAPPSLASTSTREPTLAVRTAPLLPGELPSKGLAIINASWPTIKVAGFRPIKSARGRSLRWTRIDMPVL